MGTKGFDGLIQSIGELGDDVSDNTQDASERSLKAMQTEAEHILTHEDTNYRGETISSLSVEGVRKQSDGFYQRLTVGGVSAPQATVIEFGSGDYFGRSPYPVPQRQSPIPSPTYLSSGMAANIKEWMQVKGVHDPGISDERLSWMIASSIVEEGSPGQPFFRPAYFQHEQHSTNRMKRAVRNAVRDV